MIRIKANNRKGYEEAYPYDSIDLAYPTSKNRRGRVQHGLSHTIVTSDGGGLQVVYMPNEEKYRIRKLTPKECMRLMGFDDADADRLYAIESNRSIYKQVGNSIVVQCLEAIFGQMMDE